MSESSRLDKLLEDLDNLSTEDFEKFYEENKIGANISTEETLKDKTNLSLLILQDHFKRKLKMIEKELDKRWLLEEIISSDGTVHTLLKSGKNIIHVAYKKNGDYRRTRMIKSDFFPKDLFDKEGKFWVIKYKKLAELKGDF